MAKLLIRCGMLPFEPVTVIDMLKKDRMGSNNGNLIYQYSVIRTLLTEKNEVYADGYQIDPAQAKQINETYDAYIIPLADAFRDNFRNHLRAYTKLFKQLTIPIYVIGVGIRAPYEPNLEDGFSFDQDVKAFITSVLEHSAMIGLRGQITADYLGKLGFKAEKDYTVIGCPSLYTFGNQLSIRPLILHKQSQISLNASNVSFKRAVDFLEKIAHTYANYYFIPQIYRELFLTYLGGPSLQGTVPNYPHSITSEFYQMGKIHFFLNAKTWFDYIKDMDFSVGTRLHGNIAATINGTPNLTIVQDARMRELVEYHLLAAVSVNEVNAKISLEDLLDHVDLHSAEKIHSKRFQHFIHFLDINGIDHIYKNDINRKGAPLDEKIASTRFSEPVKPITVVSDQTKFIRLREGLDIQKNKFENEKSMLLNKYQLSLKNNQQHKQFQNHRKQSLISQIVGKIKAPFV